MLERRRIGLLKGLAGFRQREKREMEKQLRSTKTLGAAAPEVDDLAAWVERSRAAEAAQKAAERAKAEKVARQFAEEVRGRAYPFPALGWEPLSLCALCCPFDLPPPYLHFPCGRRRGGDGREGGRVG